MLVKRNKEKGILAKLLEQGIRVLLIKECKKISNLKIDIISSSTQIIKGEIRKINVLAENINYKDLLFDEVKLEANDLKLNFKLKNKELYFINNPIINFKLSFSQNSLNTVLLSNNWNWIRNMISNEILNQEEIEDIRISNNELLLKAFKKDLNIDQLKKINIKTEKGKVYLENKTISKIMQIPVEDKIYIKNLTIENNLLNVFANSYISF